MKAKITHGGVTVEIEDATVEDVERVLSAIGDPLPRYPWPVKAAPWHDPYPTSPWAGDPFPFLPLTYSGNTAEVCS